MTTQTYSLYENGVPILNGITSQEVHDWVRRHTKKVFWIYRPDRQDWHSLAAFRGMFYQGPLTFFPDHTAKETWKGS